MQEKLKSTLSLWRDYAILLAGAAIMGVIVACFAVATDKAQDVFALLFGTVRLAPLVISPLAFGVAYWAVLRYFPAASGSGVPQSIAAQQVTNKKEQAHLLGMPVAAAKAVLVILALLGGASMGREGPSVQIGAAIMLFFANFVRAQDRRTLIMAGAAAGFAAAFNTPVAGIAFLIEDMARGTVYKDRLTMLAVILFSGMAAVGVTGNYEYFGYLKSGAALPAHWQPVLLIAIVCGFAGSLFNLTITDGRKRICKLFGGFGKNHPVAFAALCGFLVAALGIATGGVTFGSGYEIGHALLHGETAPLWWHPFGKIAATAISVISGVPGGTISPSLSIGATIGGAMSEFFPNIPVSVIVPLAIAGYFAAFTQSPITAVVIVLEITGKAIAVAPLFATALLAAAVSRILFPTSIFHVMADMILEDLKKKREDISHYDA